MSTGVLLHLRVRHEAGALTRIVSILNPFRITELHYSAEDSGIASASVRVDADRDIVVRIVRRLERVVPVLDVSQHADDQAADVESPAGHSPAESAEDAIAAYLAPICV